MGTKKGGALGKKGGRDPYLSRVPPMLWSVRSGRAAIYLPLILRWTSKPLTHSSGGGKGQPYLGAPGYFAKATGGYEREG